MPRKIASPSADVSSTARWEAALPSSNNTCAPATAADWGSTTLILISAAEAAASRQITLVRIRENRMHSSFVSRKGLVSTVRASLLALRVRTAFAVRRMRPAFPGFPSDRLRISSLTVARQRGILTRFPPHLVNEDARTKEVEKERKATSRFLKQNFCIGASASEPGSGIVNQLQRFLYCTVTLTGIVNISPLPPPGDRAQSHEPYSFRNKKIHSPLCRQQTGTRRVDGSVTDCVVTNSQSRRTDPRGYRW